MKMTKVACMVMALVALAATAGAQDQDREYVRELLRLMEREGWARSETGELERLMLQHRWQWQMSPEAEPVAFALGYARQAGLAKDPPATMELALELSLRAAEMRQLGFDARTIARAEVEAVRETVQAIKDGGADAPGTRIRDRDRLQTNAMLRDQLRDQIRLHEAEMLRDRTRSGAGTEQPGGPGAGPAGGAGPGSGKRP